MEISALTLKLIILLTPGALAATINKRLTVRHKPQSDFLFVITSILLGMFSYLCLQSINFITEYFCKISSPIPVEYTVIDTFKNLSSSNEIPYIEVIKASVIAIIIGFLITKFDSDNLDYKFARKFKISNKYGDENLFSNFLNSPDISWVYVRDIKNSLTYKGWISFFSENSEFKELVLEQVSVYNYPDSEELYDIERIYLCLPKDQVIIEQAIIT